MALFLAVLGGAAVAEVHRAITGGGNKDVAIMKQKEEALKKQLQEIQRELTQAKTQRELTEQEATQLAAINAELQKAKEELEKESSALKLEKEDLEARAARLLEREQLLEQCTESLKLENSILIQQFEKLKVKHEQEAVAFEEKLNSLKTHVGTTIQKFTAGEIDAKQLIQFLSEMGVQLQCSEEEMNRLERVAQKTATVEQRTEALESVELKVDDSWLQQMRLASTSQALAARLLMQGSVRQTAANAATAAAAGRPLMTPRSLEAAEQKTASHKLTEEELKEDTIPAIHASENTAPALKESNQNSQGNKSLVFRPIKKAVSKAVKNKKQAVVEVELPVPRLSLDDLSDGPVGNSMVAL